MQKAGTASLHRYISKVVWVDGGSAKEHHFFDLISSIDKHGRFNTMMEIGKLKKHYPKYLSSWPNLVEAGNFWCDLDHCCSHPYNRLTLDITPAYSFDRRVPYHMQQIVPFPHQLKFVLIIRDPVSRALSGFFQLQPHSTVSKFIPAARQELQVLKLCYNKTLSFYHSYSTDLNLRQTPISNSSDRACKPPWEQYEDLGECLGQITDVNISAKPWYRKMIPEGAQGKEKLIEEGTGGLYDGAVLRGVYVDMIHHYLCAGFKPSQFLVIASNELRADHVDVIKRIFEFVNETRPWEYINSRAGKFMERQIERNRRAKDTKFDNSTLHQLAQFYYPFNQQLLHLLSNHDFNVRLPKIVQELEYTVKYL